MFEGWKSPFAEANQQAQDRNTAWESLKGNLPMLGLVSGLSMLANNNGSRSFGQLVGRAGVDGLTAVGSMEAQRREAERYAGEQELARKQAEQQQRQQEFKNALDVQNFLLNRDKYGLDRQKLENEQRGWGMLSGVLSPGSGGTSGAPVWQQNNNPGNLRSPDGRGFQSFASMDDGLRGMGRQLDLYYTRDGLVTPAQMISKYAPANENDTAGYIASVGQMTGLDMNAPIDLSDPQKKATLMSGMLRMETGQDFPADRVLDALSGKPGGTYGTGPLAPPVIPGNAPRQGGSLSPVIGLLPGSAGNAGRWLYEQQETARQHADEQRKSDPRFIMTQEAARSVPGKIDKLAEDNQAQDALIDQFETLSSLYSRGLETGAWADMRGALASYAEGMGLGQQAQKILGLPDASVQQEFNQLVTKQVFDVLKTQSGVQTEGDAKRAAQTWATIKNTPQANMWIAELQRNVAQRQKALNNMQMNLLWQYNGDMRLVNRDLQKFKDSLPSIVPEVNPARHRTMGGGGNSVASRPALSSFRKGR